MRAILRNGFGFLSLYALACIGSPALADVCWLDSLDNTEDPSRIAEAPDLHRLLMKIDALQTRNGVLRNLPGTRLRNQVFLGFPWTPGGPRSGSVAVHLYAADSWQGDCGLKPEADRLITGSLTVSVNDPRVGFTAQPSHRDEVDTFYPAPRRTDTVGGHPMFDDNRVVIHAPKNEPWQAVTVEAFLAFKERELEKQLQETERDSAALSSDDTFDDAEIEAQYQQLKEFDAEQAEAFLRSMNDMRRMYAGLQGEHAGMLGEHEQAVVDDLKALRQLRDSLTPEQRRAPVRLGSGRFELAEDSDPQDRQLVRLNPALADGRGDPQAIRLIVVDIYANRSEYREPLRRALAAVDFPALMALLGAG